MKFKIFYTKGGSKESSTTLSSSIMPSSITSDTPINQYNFILDDLINSNKLDHTFISKIFEFNGKKIQLISLNIAQRTEFYYNNKYKKIISTMRSKKALEFINNEEENKKIEKLDKIPFREYLKQNGFYENEYDESGELYIKRLEEILVEILEKLYDLRRADYLIICLQEINKFLIEDGILKKISEKFNLKLNRNRVNDYKGTTSCILHNLDETKIEINETELKINDLLNINDNYKIDSFDLKISNNDNEQILSLYNIHTKLYENEDAFEIMRNITEFLQDKNYIIVGDMNLKLDNIYIYYLTKFFRDIRVNFYLISTPEIEYNINYLDDSSPTYDVFISKGISLLN
jgi:hypothetical protein